MLATAIDNNSLYRYEGPEATTRCNCASFPRNNDTTPSSPHNTATRDRSVGRPCVDTNERFRACVRHRKYRSRHVGRGSLMHSPVFIEHDFAPAASRLHPMHPRGTLDSAVLSPTRGLRLRANVLVRTIRRPYLQEISPPHTSPGPPEGRERRRGMQPGVRRGCADRQRDERRRFQRPTRRRRGLSALRAGVGTTPAKPSDVY